ncbi:ATP-dependent nuclease [Nostoc sp.]|uniref:ATP-dependent nuclease n=1 Tax=Nostoc sp. TaxID=1180 RepID=UPI002FF52E78
MKLETVNVKRFRSIENTELDNCGDFNVLIGKNNTGKSSILLAINAFFECIKYGNVVKLNPKFSQEIDFFKRQTNLPIEITLTFLLMPSDIDTLAQDIVREAPKMKNAVLGIDLSQRISITIAIMPPPDSFSFVQKISLVNTTKLHSNYDNPENIIFSVSEESALELFNNLLRSKEYKKKADLLLSIKLDADDFVKFQKNDNRELKRFLAYRLNRTNSSEFGNELVEIITELIDESSSYEDLQKAIKKLASTMKEESEATQIQPLKIKIGTFAGEQSSVPDYIQNLLQKICSNKVLYLTERRKQIGKEEAEKLLELKVTRGGTKILQSIQETVSALLGVRIDAFQTVSSLGNQTFAEMDVDDFLVEVNGSGIKEALRLVLDVEFERPNILLVEEPEIHLHPGLETTIMRYLKRISCNCQVFLTTHSTNFLDTGEMKNVYLISKPSSTQIRQLDIEEAEAEIPQELGIRLSSLFMFDRLIFVEGQSDEDILREWASTLGINLSQANVGFIHMGGARNFAHFATEGTLSFLTKRQIQMWFLIDRDEKEDYEVSNLQKILGQKATVKVLQRREIENYLICPRVIKDFIEFKRKSSGISNTEPIPSELEIKAKIEECAEKLKQFTVNKRVFKIACKPIYPNSKGLFKEVVEEEAVFVNKVSEEIQQIIEQLEADKNRLETLYTEKLEEVNRVWQSNKLNLVPGDTLLDMVCQAYKIRFRKERDGSKLATLMKSNEISQEIINIIQEFGS